VLIPAREDYSCITDMIQRQLVNVVNIKRLVLLMVVIQAVCLLIHQVFTGLVEYSHVLLVEFAMSVVLLNKEYQTGSFSMASEPVRGPSVDFPV
jgi:hypothetical protein